jgi:two-component system, OmpR family, sensor kinase
VHLWPNSIRWRLLLWFAALIAGISGSLGWAAYELYRLNQLAQIDATLASRVILLAADLRNTDLRPFRGLAEGEKPDPFAHEGGQHGPRHGEGRGGESGNRPIEFSPLTTSLYAASPGEYYQFWGRDGAARLSSPSAPTPIPRPDSSLRGQQTRSRAGLREAFLYTELGDCVLAGVSLTEFAAATRRFGWVLALACGAVLMGGIGGGWFIITRALRPVETIGDAARRIAAGDLAQRILLSDTTTELAGLARTLNDTFARLAAAFDDQRRFTADASHELRTPLTVMITGAQTTLARERSASEYRTTIEVNLEMAQRMRRLTEQLLTLARFDAGAEPMDRAAIDLRQLAEEGVERIRPLAAQRSLTLHCDLGPAPCLGDPARLAQVIDNLLSNATHYNREGGEIRLSTRIAGPASTLTVADTGIGIAADDLPHVFDRFFRADKVRSRADGHCGLGLAISQMIIAAHGGMIEVSSQPGAGTTFVVSLPAR